jgi:hypothetical protein
MHDMMGSGMIGGMGAFGPLVVVVLVLAAIAVPTGNSIRLA